MVRYFSTHTKTKYTVKKRFKGEGLFDTKNKVVSKTFNKFLHKMNQACFYGSNRITVDVSEKVYLALLGLMHRGYVRTFRRVMQTFVVVLATDDLGLTLYKRMEALKSIRGMKYNSKDYIGKDLFLRDYILLDPILWKTDSLTFRGRPSVKLLNWVLIVYH